MSFTKEPMVANMAGFAVNSQNPENIITLRIRSNAAGSCDDGAALDPFEVGRGLWFRWHQRRRGFRVQRVSQPYPRP
jgi:hypothetical protein